MAQREDLDELARRRGFFWPSYEIYGGVGGLYDLGPNGTSVKNRIIQLWRDHFIRSSQYPMVEIETPMVTPYEVLEASGHVESFTDPLTICPKCHRVYRADQLAELQLGIKTEGMTIDQLNELYSKETVKCEACGTRLESVQSFNLLFQTWIGPFNSERAFLRPETAQGIFTAFKRTFETARRKLPLGVAQVGRVARNEISPRQSLIRMREFTIMEFEFFFDPEDGVALPKEVADIEVRIKLSSGQLYVGALGDALKNGYVANAWMAYFIYRTLTFMSALGFSTGEVLFLEKGEKERAHYSSQTFDVMVPTKGWGDVEVAGIAYRTDYDLRHHSQKSGEDLSVSVAIPQPYTRTVVRAKVDRAAIGKRFGERSKEVIDAINQLAASGMPHGKVILNLSFGSVELDEGMVKFEEVSERVTTRKFYPHVVEPSFGADRLLYAVIDHSITEREGRKILSLPPILAPYDVAVFPLIDDEAMKTKALGLVSALRSSGFYVLYDDDGTIGRRYARVDEVGVPWAITVDDRSLKGEGVTIRDRDSWQQWRVADDQVLSVLSRLRSGEKLYQMDLPKER
ncbi:MAG: glycine--tRNA ligase [Thermoprotei archaeon]